MIVSMIDPRTLTFPLLPITLIVEEVDLAAENLPSRCVKTND